MKVKYLPQNGLGNSFIADVKKSIVIENLITG